MPRLTPLLLAALSVAAAAVPAAGAVSTPSTPQPVTLVTPPPLLSPPLDPVAVSADGTISWVTEPRRGAPAEAYALLAGASSPVDLGTAPLQRVDINGHVVGIPTAADSLSSDRATAVTLVDLDHNTRTQVTLPTGQDYVGQTGDGGYVVYQQGPASCSGDEYVWFHSPGGVGTVVLSTGAKPGAAISGHLLVTTTVGLCTGDTTVVDLDHATSTVLDNLNSTSFMSSDEVGYLDASNRLHWWNHSDLTHEAGSITLTDNTRGGFSVSHGVVASMSVVAGLTTTPVSSVDAGHPGGQGTAYLGTVSEAGVAGQLPDGTAVVVAEPTGDPSHPAIYAVGGGHASELVALAPSDALPLAYALGDDRLITLEQGARYGNLRLTSWPLSLNGTTVQVGSPHDIASVPTSSFPQFGTILYAAGPWILYTQGQNQGFTMYDSAGTDVTFPGAGDATLVRLTRTSVVYRRYDIATAQTRTFARDLPNGPERALRPGEDYPHAHVVWSPPSLTGQLTGTDVRDGSTRRAQISGGCSTPSLASSFDRWVALNCSPGSAPEIVDADSGQVVLANASVGNDLVLGDGFLLSDYLTTTDAADVSSGEADLVDLLAPASPTRTLGSSLWRGYYGNPIVASDTSGVPIIGWLDAQRLVELTSAPHEAGTTPAALTAPATPTIILPPTGPSQLPGLHLPVSWASQGATSYDVTLTATSVVHGRLTATTVPVSSGSATSAVVTLVPGALETITVVASNTGGSATAVSVPVVAPLDDTSFTFHGRWSSRTARGAWGGKVRQGQPGASASTVVYGTTLTILGPRRPAAGRLVVSVDGRVVARLKTSGKADARVVLGAMRMGKKFGRHKVLIQVTGAPAALDAVAIGFS